MTTRDIKADTKAALVHEYEAYRQAGRKADADHVAKVLKDQYSHDVAKQDEDSEADKKAATLPERADEEKAPEAAVDPKPRRTVRAKPQGDDK